MHRKEKVNDGVLALTLAALLLLGSCATAVVSPELEGELGVGQAKEVEDQIGLYSDPELAAYVSSVGQRLVAELHQTPYTFHFAIVDQHEPNAFATIGGYVYVSRGLLVQMNSEAELAGVLAHEISHVTQRHHTRQAGRSVGAGLLTLPGRAVGVVSEDLGNLINAPIEAAGQVFLSSYSRGQETEADEYGMSLAAKAGYQPTALIGALQGIERSVQYLTGEAHKASFFDSHPTTPTRVADVEKRAGSLTVTPRAPLASAAQLARQLDGMWWGPQNPQQGVFDEQVYLNADFDFRLEFAEGWKTINTPRYVGASPPSGGAYLALGGATREHSIAELAGGLTAKMREQAGLEPERRETLMIGNWPAELVRYDDSSGEETVSLYYLFLATHKGNFTLMSMGLERYRVALRETALSLRQLTAQERNSIGGQRVRLAQPQSGETVSELGRRVGNTWTPELTAIINGLELSERLPADSPIKTAHPERYLPSP